MTKIRLSHRLAFTARGVLRRTAPASLRRSAQPVIRQVLLRKVTRALSAGGAPIPGPLIVSGLLGEAKGISEGARLSLAALRAAGLSPCAHELRPLLDRSAQATWTLPTDEAGGVWLLHVNAPEALHVLGRLPPASWRQRFRIAYWAYELPRVPGDWVRASEAFHEIWAPSSFVVEALKASGVRRPVRLMPHPVGLGQSAILRDRDAFGIPQDAFAVLALGDLHSSATRKNLLGAIRIFREAFPSTGRERLVVKVREDAAHPSFLAHARRAAQGRPDIQLVTGDLSSEKMRSLVASVDLVLSPHRSEGFGLSLAEAFLAGIPALATGWSGNLDFMAPMPEMTINYRLAPVRDAYRIYRAPGLEWAEPDVADAVAKLRALASSAELRAGIAAEGKLAVEGLSAYWSRQALLSMPFAPLLPEAAVPAVGAADSTR